MLRLVRERHIGAFPGAYPGFLAIRIPRASAKGPWLIAQHLIYRNRPSRLH